MQILSKYSPLIISANIRKKINTDNIYVGNGIGKEGDLILVEVENTDIEITDQNRKNKIANKGTKIIAVLGNRESSTHVVGGIPKDGLEIQNNQFIDWIGGNSGIVGVTYISASSNNTYGAEFSTKVISKGLLYSNNKKINISDFKVQSNRNNLSIPIIAIAGTSAEAGKTVFTQKVIQYLSKNFGKVSAIKVTGSGGVLDSEQHKKAGATITLDQVDAGLITTYTSSENFSSMIMEPFLYSQDNGVDIIVCELGGDIVWANNPSFLKLLDIEDNLLNIFIICNDALSAMGSYFYLKKEYPNISYNLVASPFRNYLGMKNRVNKLLNTTIINPNDYEEINEYIKKSLLKL